MTRITAYYPPAGDGCDFASYATVVNRAALVAKGQVERGASLVEIDGRVVYSEGQWCVPEQSETRKAAA